MAAAIEAYRSAPTPNVIILETEGRNDILARPRPARHRLRRRNPRDRDRPHQRRHALSRTGAPRRQRLRHRPGQRHRRRALGLQPVLVAGSQGRRPHHCHRRRQGRRRRLHRRPQRRLGDRARPGAGFRGRRSRPRLRHRRPRLQSGPAAGHRGRGVLARPGRYRVHRPPAVEMHRPSQPAGGAGDARPGLRFRRGGLRFDLRYASHHDALHRARRSPSMVGMDQARPDRGRRHPDRRGARSRQSAQHQEHLRPPEGIAAERSRAALLPQPGRHPEASGNPRQPNSPRRSKASRSPRSRSIRRCSARPPTTAR